MTEEEWLSCTDPSPMLHFLRGNTSERKLRLIAIAYGRRVVEWMPDERSLQALDVSEQFADGLVGRKVLAAARREAYQATRSTEALRGIDRSYYPATPDAGHVALSAASDANKDDASEIVINTAVRARGLFWNHYGGIADYDEMAVQTLILRDVFRNPYRPVAIEPIWLTSTVVALASVIYQEKAFDRMPILADALEEAGCDNAEILNHCREPGEHVRGCWVVDLLLGKE